MVTIASILLVGLVSMVFVLMAVTPLVAERLEQASAIHPLDRIEPVDAPGMATSHRAA